MTYHLATIHSLRTTETDGRTDGQTTTMPIARPLLRTVG